MCYTAPHEQETCTPPGAAAGRAPGEKTSLYPQLTLRVAPPVRLQLRALAAVQGRTVAAVVTDALRAYIRTLSPAQRRALQTWVLDSVIP